MVLGSGHLFGIVRTFINPLLETDCIAESANVEHSSVYLESYVSLPSLDWSVCLLLSLIVFFCLVFLLLYLVSVRILPNACLFTKEQEKLALNQPLTSVY